MSRAAALHSLAHGLELALAGVRQLIDAPDPEEWIDQVASPLGRRRHCELCRHGVLAGARKVQGQWLVKRKELDAFIDGQGGAVEGGAAEEVAILAFKSPVRKAVRR